MALIKCKDCGKEISDTRDACIHCGCPINNTAKKENINNVYIWLVACTPLFSLFIFWIFSYITKSYWVGFVVAIIFVNIQILFIVNDYKMLNSNGVDTKPLGKFNAFKILVPKYLLNRADILKENVSYFVVWLIGVIFFIIIVLFGFNPLYLINSNHRTNDNNYMKQVDTKQVEDEGQIPENAIAGFEKLGVYVTKEELQKLLDSNSSYIELDVLERLIDEKLFSKIYSNEKDDIKKEVDEQMKAHMKYYGSEEKLLEEIKSNTYYTSIEEYKKSLLLSYYRNLAIKDYAKDQITDYDIEEYYKSEEIGNMKVSHILISPDITSEMTDEEQDKAMKKALQKAVNIIKKLDNGADFSKLAKKYSDDKETKNKGGNLGYIKKDDIVEEFFNAASKLKVNEYSKKPVETGYGYHIILKTKQKEKPTLKEVKEDIISKLAKERIELELIDSKTALKEIRESKGLSIYDEDLSSIYEQYSTEELPHGYIPEEP